MDKESGTMIKAEPNPVWQEERGQSAAYQEAGKQMQTAGDPKEKMKPETEYTKGMRENFRFFGMSAFLYACFYAFCMFRNPSGVTFPFFIAGSLLFFCFSFIKSGISLKKENIFYMVGMMLLAIAVFCTDDGRIIAMNKLGIFLLLMSFLLNQMYDTSQWKLGKYIKSILRLVFFSIGRLGRPFADGAQYRKKRMGQANGTNSGKIFLIIISFSLALPVTAIVFLLLFSADAVFREMTSMLVKADMDLSTPLSVCVMIVSMFLTAYCILAYLFEKDIPEKAEEHRTGEPVIAITATGMLTVLYLVFSVIQILYLFLGKMGLPDGYTYAEYAREGFFQLLAVGILNLIIVLTAMEYFRESRILKAVLTVMSACTFIMIASSAMRMIIYIRYYYLTFLRILVLWALAVLFLLFTGVVISIFRKEFPLFGYSCVTVTCCYLLLAFGHPDYWIARVNVSNIAETEAVGAGENSSCGGAQEENLSRDSLFRGDFFLGDGYKDYRYLSGLCADAAPVLLPYIAENAGKDGSKADERLLRYMDRTAAQSEKENLRNFNLSRHIAASLLP